MDDVARLAPQDRADLFNEAGARRGLASTIIEKDFWVCWTLRRLFTLPGDNPSLVFKGGTSLSKAYDVIRRFSEDIDLSFDRRDLGFAGGRDPKAAPSKKKAERLLESLEAEVQRHINAELVPRLKEAIVAALGRDEQAWALEKDAKDQQTVIFRYPPSLTEGANRETAHINPVVRLELGARGDAWPTERRSIQPYAAEEIPELFKAPATDVTVLAAERTFWEKATLLHAEYHRPTEKPTTASLSRHYYDLALLVDTPYGERALKNVELLEEVAKHKALFFASKWAQYETARAGSLRLVPPEERLKGLNSDYEKMKSMIFDDAPSFAAIIERLRALERRINTQR
jgi:hypothetical protein